MALPIEPALLEGLRKLLAANLGGLTELELRRQLIEKLSLRYGPTDIRQELQQHKDLFVYYATGKWRLKTAQEDDELAESQRVQDQKPERSTSVNPYLASFPSLTSVVVFDLETTGLKVERDRIIQIAAVRLVDGQPANAVGPNSTFLSAVFNEYVRLDGATLPYALQAKLGFVEHPDWWAKLEAADNLETILNKFRTWLGNLTLVAHNGRGLDFPFLERAAQSINWTVDNVRLDTMELAGLACPETQHYKLAELGDTLGVSQGNTGGQVVEEWATQLDIDFSWKNFHNAVIDVLVTAVVFERLLAEIKTRLEKKPALAGEFWRIWPTLSKWLSITNPELQSERAVVIRGLVTTTNPVITEDVRQSQEYLDFTPGTVREWFTQLCAKTGRSQRDSQLDMIEQVSHALVNDRFRLIEAPTGTGKSLAYLVPSVWWSLTQHEPVVISTQARVLQDQLANDLAELKKDLPFQAQILKGVSNYICLDRLAAQYAQTDLSQLDNEERFAWLYLLSWLSASSDGVVDEINFGLRASFPILGGLVEGMRADRVECRPSYCRACNFCFHQAAWERAERADIVVINHALLLSKDWEHSPLQFRRIMLDEAHNLEDTATDADTEEVSNQTIRYLTNRLYDPGHKQGLLNRLQDRVRNPDGLKMIASLRTQRRLVADRATEFGQRLKIFMEYNNVKIDPRYGAKLSIVTDPKRIDHNSWTPAQEVRNDLINSLRDVSQLVSHLRSWLLLHPLPAFQNETLNELEYLADRFDKEATNLDTLLKVTYDRYIRVNWLEIEQAENIANQQVEYKGPYNWAVKSAPVRIGPYLTKVLYDRVETLVLTSATLQTTREKGFEFIIDRLGLKERVTPEDVSSLKPELDYSRALFAVARYMRSDARPAEAQNFVEEVGQELGQFFSFMGGNGLALFTARQRMETVYTVLEPNLSSQNIPLVGQGITGNQASVLEELNGPRPAVALGLKSFWEGIDVKGQNLSYVIMEKLPFPMTGEPVIKARQAQLHEEGQNEFADYILPLMLIDFKQGFGRLIRGEKDLGAVLLLDKRVWTREYWPDLKAALPGHDSVKGPIILEDDRLLSRRAVYGAIVEHLGQAPSEWNLDLPRLYALLASLPEALLSGLEQRLTNLSLPNILSVVELAEKWEQVMQALAELFSFSNFKSDEQKKAVQAMLTGQDALVILPTGAGKSLAFQLPALLRDGTTLVFSPLKALMKDQVDRLVSLGLTVADRIDSSQSAEERERVYQRMREGQTRLVYIAPERIRDPKLMAALRVSHKIVQIVVDEAHCIHVWGQSFRPDFLYISQLVNAVAETTGQRPPVAALTATATPAVQTSIVERLELQPGFARIESNPNRPELRFVVYNRSSGATRISSKRDKLRVLLRILQQADRQGEIALIYVNTTREAERLARRLETAGINAKAYHGGMQDNDRKSVQDMFLEDLVKVVVATKAFGMGIDKRDIRYVIHYQIPADLESFFQEAGRAGRDGKVSWSVLLYDHSDLWLHEKIFIPNSLPDLDQLQATLNWLRSKFQRNGSKMIYIDPLDLAAALGLAQEDQQTGRIVHQLEKMNYLRRGVDVTLKATVRLLSPLAIVSQKAQVIAPDQVGQFVGQLLTDQGVNELTRTEVHIANNALALGIDPIRLDEVLYELDLTGYLIYRAIARGFSLSAGIQSMTTQPVLNNSELEQVRKDMIDNFASMKRWASKLRVGNCLREELLKYFGMQKPPTRPNQCCSLCDPNLAVPWAEEPSWEDLSDPVRYQDTRYTILKVVAWNAARHWPYGQATLSKILIGDEFGILQYEQDPKRKQERQQALVANSFFGVLEGLKGAESAIDKLLSTLMEEHFIEISQRNRGNSESYSFYQPTEAGRLRLLEGRLFN